jgi:hypothetical protein
MKRVVGALAGLVAVAAFVPAVAWAQAPVAQLTGYEVFEALQFKKPLEHTTPQAFAKRFAQAALLGNSVVSFGDPVFGASSYFGAEATSNVNINPASRTFGTGPIQGTFDLLFDYNFGAVDHLSDLAVVASGTLAGTLDLRLALDPTHPQPIAPVSGKWKLTTVRGEHGQFQGAFFIPVDLTTLGLPGLWYVQSPAGACVSKTVVALSAEASACLLDSTEYVLGIPLTKVVLVLFSDGRGGRGGHESGDKD